MSSAEFVAMVAALQLSSEGEMPSFPGDVQGAGSSRMLDSLILMAREDVEVMTNA